MLRRARLNEDVVLLQRADKQGIVGLGVVRDEALTIAHEADGVFIESDLFNRAVSDLTQKDGVRHGADTLARRAEALKDRQQHDRNDDPENHVLC